MKEGRKEGHLFAHDHLYMERRRKEGRKCGKKGGKDIEGRNFIEGRKD